MGTPSERDFPARPWPLNAEPTPEQFDVWLQSMSREQRVEVYRNMLASQRVAMRCLVQHEQPDAVFDLQDTTSDQPR